jgi:hypothetical protein
MNAKAWTLPTRTQAAWFWLRSRLLILRRSLRNGTRRGTPRWVADAALADAPVRALLRTPLWSDGRADEFMLTAGKVQNLRVAVRALDGVVVPAGECLSFWRQLGRPTARGGYVTGREIRAGCVVPTLAGGICEISNALATCAARAGFELVERHAHSASLAPRDDACDRIDATVFWNYVDLRIRAPVAWRIELKLTASELVLILRSADALPGAMMPGPVPATPRANVAKLRGCLSCGETQCFRHRPAPPRSEACHASLLDGWTPEFAGWLAGLDDEADRFLPVPPRQWLRGLFGRRVQASGWALQPPPRQRAIRRFGWVGFRRACWLRHHARDAGRRQASVIDGQRWLATAMARRLRPEHVHLVVDQGLLPHLHLLGVLGGRSYDVLAPVLPMGEIQRRLDLAAGSARSDATLTDFRAPSHLIQAEIDAMRGARQIVTAHAEVASYWRRHGGVPVLQLPWQLPPQASPTDMRRATTLPPLVVFPASSLARKGAGELAEALRGWPCRLRVLGSRPADARRWQGLIIEYGHYADDWLTQADVVVLPAHVEHAPRALLAALAAGIPVVATAACGLHGMAGVHEVVAGDVDGLRAALHMAVERADVHAPPLERSLVLHDPAMEISVSEHPMSCR